MKRVILSIAITALSTTGNAQWISGGPEIGMNLSTLSSMYQGEQSNYGTRAGLKLGGVLDIGITQHFSIQPGLYYSAKGSHSDFISATTNPDNGITTTTEQKYDYRIDYMEIPIDFQYKFGYRKNGQFFIGAGPYFAIAMGGHVNRDDITTIARSNGTVTISDLHSSYGLKLGNNPTADDIRQGDAGLNINMGFETAGGILIRANSALGIVNIMPGGDSNNRMRNNVFSLSLGYLFGH